MEKTRKKLSLGTKILIGIIISWYSLTRTCRNAFASWRCLSALTENADGSIGVFQYHGRYLQDGGC